MLVFAAAKTNLAETDGAKTAPPNTTKESKSTRAQVRQSWRVILITPVRAETD
jgi:hypothetical protein